MAAYPTSSGPRSSIVAIRWPVVSSLRCVQHTALGAAEVPDVNSSAHRTSGSHSMSPAWLRSRRWLGRRSERDVEGPIQRLAHRLGGSSASAKRSETRMPPGRSNPASGGSEQRLVAGLGDQELYVGVGDVAQPGARRVECGSARPRAAPTSPAPHSAKT